MDLIKIQQDVCDKYGFEFEFCDLNLKVGISLDEIKENSKTMPIHALRHHPVEGNTTGWYIWSGKYSEEDDFFKPMHALHLEECCPLLVPYLGLPSGTRVLIAENGNYVDIWEDLNLLES